MLPTAWGNAVNNILSAVYPASMTHYNAIKSVSPGEAANYELFLLLIILLHLFLAILAIKRFLGEQATIARPGFSDIFYLIVGIPLSYYVLIIDGEVRSEPKPFWDFYVDNFGFYYVRQEIAAAAVLLYAIFLVIFGMKLLAMLRSRGVRG